MKHSNRFHPDFEPGSDFHIYSRTNNKELLFRQEIDYKSFLKKSEYFLSPFMGVYCRNLLPNHFHFLVRINDEATIVDHLRKIKNPCQFESKFLQQQIDFSVLLEREFSRLFNSYATAFNRKYSRTGHLFDRPFKRLKIETDSHFTRCVIYIHANAVKHKLVTEFTDYPWTSWHELISDQPTKLLRTELIEWFGGRPQMIKAHYDLTQYYFDSEISIENDSIFDET